MIFKLKQFNVNQSRLSSDGSCIHQLITVTNNIFTAFYANPSLEVCHIFLVLFRAVDRVIHKGLLRKLKNNGIDGNLSSLIESFFITSIKEFFLKVNPHSGTTLTLGYHKDRF